MILPLRLTPTDGSLGRNNVTLVPFIADVRDYNPINSACQEFFIADGDIPNILTKAL